MKPEHGSLKNKTSFYYPFLLLPREKRRALEALYRFCWAADDISDSPSPIDLKKKKLREFKKETEACFKGKNHVTLFQNLFKAIEEFNLSKEPLRRILQGVERDLKPIRFKTFTELHRYALQVAGGPGLVSMEIFGFKDKAHSAYAENLGVFLQIVNMVRDYKEDMGLNRQYFPTEDFKRFHLNPFHLDEKNSNWPRFVDFQLNRAWSFLQASRNTLTHRQRGDLPTAEAIAGVYVKLYQKLKNHPFQILKGRASLSKADKLISLVGASSRCLLWKVVGH